MALLYHILMIAGLLAVSGTNRQTKDCHGFECPNEDGKFADPCNCRRFFICASGIPTTISCPSGLYWDDVGEICTYKNEATCGPVEKKKKEETEEIPKCDKEACQLPFCFCSKDGTKGPLPESQDNPQVIVVMFDGAVNTNNVEYYDNLLKIKRSNRSEECPIRGTFFVTHNYNNYHMVEQFYARGHEIAVGSVTGDSLQHANESTWRTEMKTMKRLLKELANIPPDDILGARAPRLRPGFDSQFKVLVEEGFVWDSSISTESLAVPLWPYSLDYRIPHECKIKSCPTKAYPGFWEIPANLHFVADQSGGRCSYMDQCVFAHFDEDDVFEWLKEDFLRFYESNRAPYLMPFNTNWFTQKYQVNGLTKFVKWTLEKPDIYYLTGTELLIYITEPSRETLEQLSSQCNSLGRKEPCGRPNNCVLSHKVGDVSELRYMSTCNECPSSYPWV